MAYSRLILQRILAKERAFAIKNAMKEPQLPKRGYGGVGREAAAVSECITRQKIRRTVRIENTLENKDFYTPKDCV